MKALVYALDGIDMIRVLDCIDMIRVAISIQNLGFLWPTFRALIVQFIKQQHVVQWPTDSRDTTHLRHLP